MTVKDDPLTGFEQQWQEWVQRPPETPAAVAAERVVAAVGRQRRVSRRPRWVVSAVAAAALLVAAFTAHLVLRSPLQPVPTVRAPAVAPLGSDEVLIWLDADTPLYMTFQEPTGGTS